MAYKEAGRIQTDRLKEAMLKAAEEAHFDAFHGGFESSNRGLPRPH